MMSYQVASMNGDQLFPVADVDELARQRWGDAVKWVRPTAADRQMTVSLDPDDGPAYSIRFDSSGDSVETDGTREQTAAVAVWARSLLPASTSSEIWLFDWNGHAALTPELTEDQVWDRWVDD